MRIPNKVLFLTICLCTSIELFSGLYEDVQSKYAQYQKERQELSTNKSIMESGTQKQWMNVLDEAERCMQQVKTWDEYITCEQKEQEAKRKTAEKSNLRNEALKEQAKKLHNTLEQKKNP